MWGQNTYNYMPDGFMNYSSFIDKFEEKGLHTLWNHVKEWGEDPAYLDRDSYSVDYFDLLLKGKLPRPNIGITQQTKNDGIELK